MKEIERAVVSADLDSISLGRVMSKIVIDQYGKYNSKLFLRGFKEILESHD